MPSRHRGVPYNREHPIIEETRYFIISVRQKQDQDQNHEGLLNLGFVCKIFAPLYISTPPTIVANLFTYSYLIVFVGKVNNR